MTSDVTAVQQSYGRSQIKSGLMDRFYDIFLASHPDIGPRFEGTNMAQQKGLLRQGLNLAIMFASDNPVGQGGIARIRASHSKTKLNIPPTLYRYWLDSFVKAVSEFDPQFTAELERQWRAVLQKSIDFISEGYDKDDGSDRQVA